MAKDTFALIITLGNDAMRSKRDVADALLVVARQLGYGQSKGLVRDTNGNRVGSYVYRGTDEEE